jgi:hypothetical protein
VSKRAVVVAGLVAAWCAAGPSRAAGDVLHRADVAVRFLQAGACDVTMTFEIETRSASPIRHHLGLPAAGRIAGFVLDRSASVTAAPPASANGRVLHVVPTGPGVHAYRLRYRVVELDDGASRCPLWLPLVSADGIARAVSLAVRLPPAARLVGSTFPPLDWSGGEGRAVLPHLPASVRVPFAPADRPPDWRERLTLSRVVDAVAIGTLIAASAVWVATRRRR